METLKEELKRVLNLKEECFDSHCNDLYVKGEQKTIDYLKENYEFYCNVEEFTSQIDGTLWLDIPFAYREYRTNKLNKKGE